MRLMPAASAESLFGSVWVPADGFLDPHTATYALANAARALGARIRTGERVTAIELDEREIDPRDPNGARPRRVRGRRGRRGDLGAAGGGDGGRADPLDARRPPARGPEGRARLGAAARHAVLPRPGPPRLREGGVRRDRVRRVRAGSGRSMDRRRALGARRAVASPRHGAVRAAASRGGQAVPVHRRRRDREARVSSGRDDSGREPARRTGADRPRPVVRSRAVAERVRSRRGARPRSGRMDRGGRPGRRPHRVPPVALRTCPRRRRVGRGARPRDLPLLLPAPLPVRSRRVGKAETAVAAARSPAGRGRGVPGEARVGAAGALRARRRPGGGRARTSGRSAGRVHRGSTGWARSIVPSGSGPGCSISARSGRSR